MIELLVVVSIISLLSSIVLSSVNTAREKARVAAGRSFSAQAFRVAGDMAAGVWDFNEGSGNTAADRSGYGYNGTVTIGASYSTDTYSGTGWSLSLNGTSGWVDVPYYPNLAPVSGVSFGAWFKANNLSNNQRIISKTEGGGYHLSLNEGSGFCPGGAVLCALVFAGGTYHGAVYPLSNLAQGKWHHAMASYDGETLKLYVDGKEVASNTAPSGGVQYAVLNSLCIGTEAGSGTCTASSAFNGLVDEPRIFAKGLTASEVGKIYALEAPRFKLARE